MPKKLTTSIFIERAIKKHGNLYDYQQVDYVRGNQKVTISCAKHGPFEQTAANHLNGAGCPYCAIETASDNKRLSKESFVERAIVLYGEYYSFEKELHRDDTLENLYIGKQFGGFTECYKIQDIGVINSRIDNLLKTSEGVHQIC